MSKYIDFANKVIELIGGEDNVISLYHCMTRLRFKLKDYNVVQKDLIAQTEGVLSVVEANNQLQIVIGNDVVNYYKCFYDKYHFLNPMNDSVMNEDKPQGKIYTRFFSSLSMIFTPIVPALAGAGMLKALLVILTTYGFMSADASTYKILSAAGNSVFYFLPLFLAYSSAKTFKCNPFISLAIVAALLEPNFTGLMEANGDIVDFFGIPTVLMGYSGTVIPAIISIFVYSKLEIILKRFVPKTLDIFLTPLIALLIMVPLTILTIGPVGVWLGNGLGAFINYLSSFSGLLAGAFIGATWVFLVMIGVHWGVVPIMINNLAVYGYDVIRPMIAAATFAIAGAALGAFIKFKKKEDKALALSSLFPALLGGIGEPIIYGILVKYKKALISEVIAAGIAGALMGFLQTKAYAYVFPALTTLPAFFGDTFTFYIMGISVAFVLSAVLTYFYGIGNGEVDAKLTVGAFAEGTTLAIEEVNDAVFSSKSMGDGIAIVPKNGKIFSPIDGEIISVFPTKHAIGIRSKNGLEFLIHVGIDTVNLNGVGFDVLVKEGQKVKQGQNICNFDFETFKEKGLDITTILVITNKQDEIVMKKSMLDIVDANTIILTIEGK